MPERRTTDRPPTIVDPPEVCVHDSRKEAYDHAEQEPWAWHAGPWNTPIGFTTAWFHGAAPDVCDCGYQGSWQYRFLLPAHNAARQERCPSCGDVESFDGLGNVAQQRNPDRRDTIIANAPTEELVAALAAKYQPEGDAS